MQVTHIARPSPEPRALMLIAARAPTRWSSPPQTRQSLGWLWQPWQTRQAPMLGRLPPRLPLPRLLAL